MSKNAKISLILFLLVSLATSLTFAQSKKQLREQILQLQQENTRLNQEYNQVEAETERLRQENQTFVEQNMTLRSQVTQLQRDNDALNQQYQALNNDYEALKASSSGGYSGGGGYTGGGYTPPSAGGNTGGGDPAAGDSRKCAYYQGRLTPNTTYTALYSELNSDGWGIQVHAYRSLCQAAEKAEQFKKKFSMYKTYIRVKEVNGQQVYAVVYGSLRERSQAATYLRNLKAKYRSTFGSSFLVQH